MSPSSRRWRIASVSTRRTSPVSCMSTPSITPCGLAVMKLPLTTRGCARPPSASSRSRARAAPRCGERTWPVGLEHAVHRLGVGDAQAERVAALDVLLREDRLDLRPRAVDDDEADAEAVQQVQVVDDAEERVVGDDLAAERDDERPAAERVDVRRRRADPLHERARRRGVGGGRGVAGSAASAAAGEGSAKPGGRGPPISRAPRHV